MSAAAEVDTRSVEEIACELVADMNREMGQLYDQIGNLASARSMHLQALFLAVGQDMLEKMHAKGQKSTTKRIGQFIVEVGETPVQICTCHGTFRQECDTVGTIEVIERPPEPYIKVRDLRNPAAQLAEAF